MTDQCADCGKEKPDMHNHRGATPDNPHPQRQPGYLCVECWKLANPAMFPGSQPVEQCCGNPQLAWWFFWAMVIGAMLAGLIASQVAK